MSLNEILDELPKLNAEERVLILHRIEELDQLADPKLLAAIDEADAASRHDDISAEDLQRQLKSWVRTE